jgi:hypothetical protein
VKKSNRRFVLEYILSWQVTTAIFIIAMVIMWGLSGLLNTPRWVSILVAAAIAITARYYWWAVDAKITEWMRFMGMEV